MASTKRDRITTRVSRNVRKRVEEAADMTGSNLNQFMVAAAMKEAERVIARERSIRIEEKYVADFFGSLDAPGQPNERLLKAVKEYKEVLASH